LALTVEAPTPARPGPSFSTRSKIVHGEHVAAAELRKKLVLEPGDQTPFALWQIVLSTTQPRRRIAPSSVRLAPRFMGTLAQRETLADLCVAALARLMGANDPPA
jgi:hypothetical protein